LLNDPDILPHVPSVEALNRRAQACLSACDGVELEWLETGLPGCVQGLREDRDNWQKQAWDAQSERSQLRTTNAAQAEQLAAQSKVPDVDWLANVIRAADGNHSLGAGALSEKIVEALLQSSIPPEPQAGVELTDEDEMFCAAWLGIDSDHIDKQSSFGNDIRNYIAMQRKDLSHKSSVAEGIGPTDELQTIKDAADFLQHYIDWMYEEKPDLERHPYIPSMQQCVDELRALNQRQAVKTEPQQQEAQVLAEYINRMRVDWRAGAHSIGNILAQAARYMDDKKVSAAPLSAAQGVPECMPIDAEPGSKVIYAFPNNGMSGDRAQLQKLGLVVGAEYTVAEVRAGGFSSSVLLAEFPGHVFNTVNFAAAPEQAESKEGKV
jgi:hypothetical protein